MRQSATAHNATHRDFAPNPYPHDHTPPTHPTQWRPVCRPVYARADPSSPLSAYPRSHLLNSPPTQPLSPAARAQGTMDMCCVPHNAPGPPATHAAGGGGAHTGCRAVERLPKEWLAQPHPVARVCGTMAQPKEHTHPARTNGSRAFPGTSTRHRYTVNNGSRQQKGGNATRYAPPIGAFCSRLPCATC